MSGRNVLDLAVIVVLVLVLALTCHRREEDADPREIEEMEFELGFADNDLDYGAALPDSVHQVYYKGKKLAYASIFNDINDLHLEAARKVGLTTAPDKRDNIDPNRWGLVMIGTNASYTVAKLTHSVPYLTPGASKELSVIADNFCKKLRDNDLPYYRLIVNSVLRTKEDVAKLRQSGNVNASENSAHSYATTFDISYTKYNKADDSIDVMDPYELTKVLAEVLRDERDAGRCYVKYEKKQHCFHITCRLK